MLLRTRVTLIVSLSYSVLVAGLMFAGLKSEELADERYAQATLNGQDVFWRKLVENTVQRLESNARTIEQAGGLLDAVDRRDPTQVLLQVGPVADSLRAQRHISRFELLNRDGELLYSSRGSLLEPPIVDAGTVHTIVETGKAVRGVQQDTSRAFTATLALPMTTAGRVVGVAVLAADMTPPLLEFKLSTGSDIFLVDRLGHLSQGTDEALWRVFDGKLPVRKSRLENWSEGDKFYSVAVLPVQDGSGRVIGALVTARDVTATQARQRLIRQVSIVAVIGFLGLVLGIFYVYLRRSFHPLDEAIQVLNALSRGDTSVTLEVGNTKDEIGRIAGTVGVFRDNAVKLELMQQRRERQRRRQELFIRLQMLKLSEMLEEEARAAILHDLQQIEQMSQREDGGDEAGKGELEVLGVAFQTMSDRIREQHDSLEELIAERTREADILREALHNRDQLNLLRQELDFARELQLSSLPQVFPPFPERDEFQIHASMVPAKEVGGDFYDFFLIDHHHLGFVIGDASGKGVPAAMFIAITRSLIKAVAPLSRNPGECLAFVNTMLAADNPQTLFATCFYAVLDTRNGEVAFCNAGHPPSLILRQGGGIEAIRDVSGVALGVMEDLEYETGTFTLAPGDTVLLYTDGVTEAQDVAEKLYDEPRLIEELGRLSGVQPEAIIAGVQQAVEAFVGEAPQFDDITMLALRFDRQSLVSGTEEAPQRRLMLTGFPTPPPTPAPAPVPPVVQVAAAAPKPVPSKPAVSVKLRPMAKKSVAVPAAPEPPKAPEPPPPPPPSPAPEPEPMPVLDAGLQPLKEDFAPAPEPVRSNDGKVLEAPIINDLPELSRLAGLVDDYFAALKLPERIAFNLNLCLDELITNIVSYGYDDRDRHLITCRFTLDGSLLKTEIIDDGKEYNPFIEAPEPDLDAGVDDRPIGGLGVFLVKEFMDRTEYRRENGSNVVTLWKDTAEQGS